MYKRQAYGVVANFALVGTAVFNGIGQGIQPLASEVYGKSNQEEKQLIIRSGTLYTAAAALFLSLIHISLLRLLVRYNSQYFSRSFVK